MDLPDISPYHFLERTSGRFLGEQMHLAIALLTKNCPCYRSVVSFYKNSSATSCPVCCLLYNQSVRADFYKNSSDASCPVYRLLYNQSVKGDIYKNSSAVPCPVCCLLYNQSFRIILVSQHGLWTSLIRFIDNV
ncbi:hypothetical protein TNCV_4287941 [Trichonephila clavipes]|uniref:Uncharacterized protein n=1 Tax=Trichonephila clavipes TaxID=2585209 RepID=A0A8X6SAK9_TRICX|nr:hypothetical protein TNCV_4287941 [Trichonephila clavipes]